MTRSIRATVSDLREPLSININFHYVSSLPLTLDLIKACGKLLEPLIVKAAVIFFCLQQNVSSQLFSQHYITEENYIFILRENALSLMSSRWCCTMQTLGRLCPQESPRYNAVKWLIALTWTHHADISSYGSAEDSNKQCRRQAGWADKAEQTKALTVKLDLPILFTQSLLHRQLHDHPVALWVFEKRTHFKSPLTRAFYQPFILPLRPPERLLQNIEHEVLKRRKTA